MVDCQVGTYRQDKESPEKGLEGAIYNMVCPFAVVPALGNTMQLGDTKFIFTNSLRRVLTITPAAPWAVCLSWQVQGN